MSVELFFSFVAAALLAISIVNLIQSIKDCNETIKRCDEILERIKKEARKENNE